MGRRIPRDRSGSGALRFVVDLDVGQNEQVAELRRRVIKQWVPAYHSFGRK